jgi:hypothetical protein
MASSSAIDLALSSSLCWLNSVSQCTTWEGKLFRFVKFNFYSLNKRRCFNVPPGAASTTFGQRTQGQRRNPFWAGTFAVLPPASVYMEFRFHILFFEEPSFLEDETLHHNVNYFHSVHGMFSCLPHDLCCCPDTAIQATNHGAFLLRIKILR